MAVVTAGRGLVAGPCGAAPSSEEEEVGCSREQGAGPGWHAATGARSGQRRGVEGRRKEKGEGRKEKEKGKGKKKIGKRKGKGEKGKKEKKKKRKRGLEN
jgi:hypothetical protein